MGDVLDSTPLPRYRYHHSTGQWRKEVIACITAAEVAEKQAKLKKEIIKKVQGSPESSFDYFLRKSYAVEKAVDAAARETKQRDHTRIHMETFQRAHLSNIRKVTSEVEANSAILPIPALPEGGASDESSNPVLGFLMGVAPHVLYESLVNIKGPIFPLSPLEKLPSLDLSQFIALLHQVRPETRLSEDYMRRMFVGLPIYSKFFDHVAAFDFYTYVLDHTYHPHLDGNVEMLFHAFDPKGRDLIPIEALNARVVAAYAELSTFGNLRESWLQLSNALAEVEEDGGLPWDVPPILDMTITAAVLASSERLYEVVNSVDLEGGGNMGKRIFKNREGPQ